MPLHPPAILSGPLPPSIVCAVWCGVVHGGDPKGGGLNISRLFFLLSPKMSLFSLLWRSSCGTLVVLFLENLSVETFTFGLVGASCQSAVRSLEVQVAQIPQLRGMSEVERKIDLSTSRCYSTWNTICSSLKSWMGGIFLSPLSNRRDERDLSQELEWMPVEENQPRSGATGNGRVGTGNTTLIARVEPSSFRAAGNCLPVHFCGSKIVCCPEASRHPHKILTFTWGSLNKWRDTQLSRRRKLKNFEIEA